MAGLRQLMLNLYVVICATTQSHDAVGMVSLCVYLDLYGNLSYFSKEGITLQLKYWCLGSGCSTEVSALVNPFGGRQFES